MVFKIHSRCNLNCTYCYMYNKGDLSYLDMPGRVSLSVVEAVAEMILADHRKTARNDFSIAFHGGEPLLVGKAFFDEMMTTLRARLGTLRVKYALQTNGTLIDAEWLALLERHGVIVSVSLDGPARVHDLNRVDHGGRGSFDRTLQGIRLLQDSDVIFAGALCVVQPEADGHETVEFFADQLGLEWFDFLLPDYTHDDLPADWADRQQAFGRFLCDAFAAWYPHSRRGVACRFFDSTIARLMGRWSLVDTIGQDGLGVVIIENDGSLEPHDVLRICRSYDRVSRIQSGAGALAQFRESPAYLRAENAGRSHCQHCQQCAVFDICRGGHLIHRFSASREFDNPSVHCAALKQYIDFVQSFLGGELLPAGKVSVHP